MKKTQNFALFFTAILAMLVTFVFTVAQMPGGPNIPCLIVAGLAVSALVLAGCDLAESRRSKH